jgi:hypothetical protein
MQKIRTFSRTFWKSITSLPYYAHILRAKFSFSVKYFAFTHLLIGLIITVFAMMVLSTVDFSYYANQALSTVPRDLVVTLKNDQVSINKPLPFAIPIPPAWQYQMAQSVRKDSAPLSVPIKNMIVFDTNSHLHGIADMSRYQTLVLVTEDTIYTVANASTSEVRAYPISSKEHVENGSFSATQLFAAKDRFFNLPVMFHRLYVWPIGAAMLLIVTPLLFLCHFITAMIYSFVMYLIANLFKDGLFHHRKYAYKQVLQVSLITLVPVLLVEMLTERVDMFGLHGWWFFLIYLLFTGAALHAAGAETAVVARNLAKKTARAKK